MVIRSGRVPVDVGYYGFAIALIAYWLFFFPQTMGIALGRNCKDTLAKDFKKKCDKRYFLFILAGLLCFVLIMISELFFGNVSLSNTLITGVIDFNFIKTAIYKLGTIGYLLLFLAEFILLAFVCASFVYAYSSWLSKADLKEVGEYFNLTLKEENESDISVSITQEHETSSLAEHSA